jgi:hypothetical protein
MLLLQPQTIVQRNTIDVFITKAIEDQYACDSIASQQ